MLIKRHMEKTIYKSAKNYQTVLLAGARQVGKSTIFESTIAKDIPQFTLDDLGLLSAIKSDAAAFLRLNPPPIFIDEIQYAPELFRGIKMIADKQKEQNGLYFMTGSQKFELMQGVSESLAGRITVLDLLGLSAREISGDTFDLPFFPTEEYLLSRKPKSSTDLKELWKIIHRGSMPRLVTKQDLDWEKFYADYLTTYIERDVRKLTQVGDMVTFVNFMTALAARTGQLLNYASIARDAGISEPTAKKWLSILEASNVIFLLRPFSLNITSRVVKAPKVYFLDTGFACFLCKWVTPETLVNGAMSGQMFETYIIGEILKSYYNAGKEPPMYFYRNDKAEEIDLLFYQNGTLHPIEIKKTASPNVKDISVFKQLAKAYPSVKVGDGGLICTYDKVLQLAENVKIIPYNFL